MNKDNKVSLGCGTLILIVLIVMLFGNVGSQQLEPQIQSLQSSMQNLERQLEEMERDMEQQTRHIKTLLDEVKKKPPLPIKED
jgi:uncharacterized protein YoxC